MHGREERFRIIDRSPPLGLSYLTAHFVIGHRSSVIGSSWLSGEALQLHLSRPSRRAPLAHARQGFRPTRAHLRISNTTPDTNPSKAERGGYPTVRQRMPRLLPRPRRGRWNEDWSWAREAACETKTGGVRRLWAVRLKSVPDCHPQAFDGAKVCRPGCWRARRDRAHGKNLRRCRHAFTQVRQCSQHLAERGDQARRKTRLLKGETERKRIGIPCLGDVQQTTCPRLSTAQSVLPSWLPSCSLCS